jgi:Lon protease-like protein
MSSGERRPPGAAKGPTVDRTLARALRRMPVFPLPGVVLFPHALLPLHIFEPRYRKMTKDVLATDKLMVIALQLQEEEQAMLLEGLPPRFAEVASVGEVVMAQELPDGRYNIVLRGRARIRVDQELTSDEPYRLIAGTEVPDDPPRDPGELVDAEASLRSLITGLADALPEGGELLKQVVAAQASPAELANVAAAALVSEAQRRQSLLETTDLLERIEGVSSEVVALTGRVGPDRRVN